MLEDQEYLSLIAKYLNNPTDQPLQQAVSKFRSVSSENDAYFLEIEKLWEQASAAARLEEVNEKEAVQRFKQILKRNTVVKSSALIWVKSIAAAAVLFVGGYLFYSYQNRPVLLTKITAANQTDSVKLADGSTVVLAGNSELQYPDKFASTTREITLSKGQAFFRIAKDPQHPFKVVLNKSDVTVLGTSFNIKRTDSTIDLAVKTGKVLFSPYENGTSSILIAGQALSYDIEKKELRAKTAQNEDAWLTKELVFEDTSLEEVCKQLTSYYGVVIKVQNERSSSKKLNARFHNQSLEDVLLILNETYNIKIKRDHNKINLVTP